MPVEYLVLFSAVLVNIFLSKTVWEIMFMQPSCLDYKPLTRGGVYLATLTSLLLLTWLTTNLTIFQTPCTRVFVVSESLSVEVLALLFIDYTTVLSVLSLVKMPSL